MGVGRTWSVDARQLERADRGIFRALPGALSEVGSSSGSLLGDPGLQAGGGNAGSPPRKCQRYSIVCSHVPVSSVSPAPAQEAVLRDHCAHARYVWNLAVEQHAHWRLGRPGAPGYLEQCRQLTATRAEHPWLAAGSQTVQQQALRDFAGAMTAFFDPGSPAGRPSWRKAGRDRRGGLCRGRGRARRPHRRARVRRGRSRCRRGRWRRSLRWSSCLLPVRLYQFQDVRSTMMARVRTDGKRGRRTAQALAELFGIPLPFGYGKLGGGIACGYRA